jgi:hypothetical protein
MIRRFVSSRLFQQTLRCKELTVDFHLATAPRQLFADIQAEIFLCAVRYMMASGNKDNVCRGEFSCERKKWRVELL